MKARLLSLTNLILISTVLFNFSLGINGLMAQPQPQGVTPRWPIIQSYTVATLPTSGVRNRIAFVIDAASTASCTVGGGSTVLLCRDNGTAWSPAGDGSTAGTGATHYSGSSALDLPSIPDGTCHLATTAITVTNAALGHRTVVGTSAAFPEGIVVTAIVTGPNSMKVQLCNNTGAAYDPASITYTLGVIL